MRCLAVPRRGTRTGQLRIDKAVVIICTILTTGDSCGAFLSRLPKADYSHTRYDPQGRYKRRDNMSYRRSILERFQDYTSYTSIRTYYSTESCELESDAALTEGLRRSSEVHSSCGLWLESEQNLNRSTRQLRSVRFNHVCS